MVVGLLMGIVLQWWINLGGMNFFLSYLSIWKRGRECTRVLGAEGEGQKTSSRLWDECAAKCGVWSHDPEIIPELRPKVRHWTNGATQGTLLWYWILSLLPCSVFKRDVFKIFKLVWNIPKLLPKILIYNFIVLFCSFWSILSLDVFHTVFTRKHAACLRS